MLEERLSDSRLQVSALRQGEDDLLAKLSQLQNDLQRSESKSNQLEMQLESSRKFLADAKGDSSAADNYLREELSRMKAEAEQSKERARESRKTVRERMHLTCSLCLEMCRTRRFSDLLPRDGEGRLGAPPRPPEEHFTVTPPPPSPAALRRRRRR